MILDVTFLIAGLVLLMIGGDILVRGAAALAHHMGVSSLVIGLTVVAFGTSAPELAVNLLAAIRDRPGVSFGNIVGSNIANIGLILGVCALMRPLALQPSIVRREIPMMLLGTAAAVVLAVDGWFGAVTPGAAAPPDAVSRADGLVLALLFVVFCYYTIHEALRQRHTDAYLAELQAGQEIDTRMSRPVSALFLIGGLTGVVGGGYLTVEGAVGVAEALGVDEAVVGLTAVALGTSLPELATGVMAVRRGHTDIAVGNVVGSNIFNLLLVLAATAMVRPIGVPDGGREDLLVMALLSVALLPVAASGSPNRISRPEGGLLLLVYIAYLGWRAIEAVSAG